MLKRYTDCIYFMSSPSSCKKGIHCEYRHSDMARRNPRKCWYWTRGGCFNPTCGFRHPPLDGHFEPLWSKNSFCFPDGLKDPRAMTYVRHDLASTRPREHPVEYERGEPSNTNSIAEEIILCPQTPPPKLDDTTDESSNEEVEGLV